MYTPLITIQQLTSAFPALKGSMEMTRRKPVNLVPVTASLALAL